IGRISRLRINESHKLEYPGCRFEPLLSDQVVAKRIKYAFINKRLHRRSAAILFNNRAGGIEASLIDQSSELVRGRWNRQPSLPHHRAAICARDIRYQAIRAAAISFEFLVKEVLHHRTD